MILTIKNDALTLSVETLGAEMMSIKNSNNEEMLWQGDDASYWAKRAPLLFPWVGLINGNYYTYKGKRYDAEIHGIAQHFEHTVIEHTSNKLVLAFESSEKTKELYPFDFLLTVSFILDGNILHHKAEVLNKDTEDMLFGIGYHPGFLVPFDAQHKTSDYEIRFDKTESPIAVSAYPNGLINGKSYYVGKNINSLPLYDGVFDGAGSHCMCNLTSDTISIVEKDTGRKISANIADFPYTTIWSANTPASKPLKYVCLEPWHTIPCEENDEHALEKKASVRLESGKTFDTTLTLTFDR